MSKVEVLTFPKDDEGFKARIREALAAHQGRLTEESRIAIEEALRILYPAVRLQSQHPAARIGATKDVVWHAFRDGSIDEAKSIEAATDSEPKLRGQTL